MKKRKNFRKRPKDDSKGLSVKVWNNNVEGALKVFKRKVKDSNYDVIFDVLSLSGRLVHVISLFYKL